MPEGPEIKVIGEYLNTYYNNFVLCSISIRDTFKKGIPGYAESLFPRKLLYVTSKGKRIIFVFEQNIYIVAFLGMEGKFVATRKEIGKHTQCIFHFIKIGDSINQLDLYFDDTRHFGSIILCSNDMILNETLKTVGPCLLTQTELITRDYFINVFRKQRSKDKKIVEFLLDQKYFSGIGNYLRSEILYRCKISPHRLLKELSDDDIDLIRIQSMLTIWESYKAGGLTIYTFLSPDGTMGNFNNVIYNKLVDPSGNCIVKEYDKNKRSFYWTPVIQK